LRRWRRGGGERTQHPNLLQRDSSSSSSSSSGGGGSRGGGETTAATNNSGSHPDDDGDSAAAAAAASEKNNNDGWAYAVRYTENGVRAYSTAIGPKEEKVAQQRGRRAAVQGDTLPPPVSPRRWLESMPADGAYTVVRCDYCDSDDNGSGSENCSEIRGNEKWRVWGKQFHLRRLRNSIVNAVAFSSPKIGGKETKYADDEEEGSRHVVDPSIVDTALMNNRTELVIDWLLDEAAFEIERQRKRQQHWGAATRTTKCGDDDDEEETETSAAVAVAMLTILWYYDRDAASVPTTAPSSRRSSSSEASCPAAADTASICVSGHVTLASSPSSRTLLPPAVRVALATTPATSSSLPSSKTLLKDESTSSQQKQFKSVQFPNRQPFPTSKLSSWCRKRRPLEDRFMPDGEDIGEVVLTKPSAKSTTEMVLPGGGTSVALLEGLTSNLFIRYSDGTLRTAPDHQVLNGYARHLVVLAAAQQTISLPIQFTCPLLEERHMWEDVFLTSSIRLIVPVREVVVLLDGGNKNRSPRWQTIWSRGDAGTEICAADASRTPPIDQSPLARQLLDEIWNGHRKEHSL